MALYLIGDVQGCNAALGRLLATLAFSPSRDAVILLGDLVNRGPDSLGVLRRVMALDGAARALLGNHDIHLLAVAAGVRVPGRKDTLDGILHARDRGQLLDWLRFCPLAFHEHGLLMVHAGVLPQWTRAQVLAHARELEAVLRRDDWRDQIAALFGNAPDGWDAGLQGPARWRVIVNALTRLRFCTAAGKMEFASKGGMASAPAGYLPWFDVPGRRTAGEVIAFGHWSTLEPQDRGDILPLDSGCVWGRCLTALRVDAATGQHERISVRCAQAASPGG